MQCNIGKADMAIRIVAGLLIIAAGAAMQSWWGAIGIIPLATGILRWCPAYTPLGISTAKCCSTDKSCCNNKSEDKK